MLNAKQIERVVCFSFLSINYAFFAFVCLLGSFGLTMSSQLSIAEAESVTFLLIPSPEELASHVPPCMGPSDRLVALRSGRNNTFSTACRGTHRDISQECHLYRALYQLPHRMKSGICRGHCLEFRKPRYMGFGSGGRPGCQTQMKHLGIEKDPWKVVGLGYERTGILLCCNQVFF